MSSGGIGDEIAVSGGGARSSRFWMFHQTGHLGASPPDPRVHFALNCMVKGCPRLPREPFEASRLDAQLDAAARLFFSEARNVELRPEKKVVRFSEILRFYPKDFLARAPTLIAYANQYRVEKIPTDWKVEFIPYDWKLNKQ